VEAIHHTALRVIEELGVRVLNDEARRILSAAGAEVSDHDLMVRMDRGLVARALSSAPGVFEVHGGSTEFDIRMGADSIVFGPVGGPAFVSDIDRGRRPGTLEELRNLIRLAHSFDVVHMLSQSVEPQDVDLNVRHLQTTFSQLTLSGKVPFVYSRGSGQVHDCFEMIRIARGLTREEFTARPWCYTIINTNSPRQLDVPMCQGIIDFARAGQMVVVTPFTLSGAMAPVTIPGALTLQHAEALAGITLNQLVRPGAPVVYGSFTSNVDMKSGSPAFGTPEFVKGALGAGQLARHVGLPWRGSAATASNAPDEQAVYETMMSIWGSVLGGVNLLKHSAGWLEGGLTASKEKFILDVEVLQMMAESLQPLDADDAELGFDAIAAVEPGGHFFAAQHTMERYQSAFYAPMLSDWRNFGEWTNDGSRTALERANAIWKDTLDAFEPPDMPPGRMDELTEFVERRTREGGCHPLD
jgi:trimethylamine--corrinoid protein Co-methyltransferase